MRDRLKFILLSVLYFKIVQKCLVVVLGGEASVSQITVDVSPFTKAPIVEKLMSSVSVLERMDEFEPLVKVNDKVDGVGFKNAAAPEAWP